MMLTRMPLAQDTIEKKSPAPAFKKSKKARLASFISKLTFFLLYGFFYAGWLFHRSEDAGALPYSSSYLFFLAVMALPFLLPFAASKLLRGVPRKWIVFALAPAVLFLAVLYFISSIHYNWTQRHYFDPYLQNPPARIPAHTKKGAFRILFLGGSTTQGADLAPENRYPEILRRKIEAESGGRPVEILNAGVAFYTTKHSLINYVTYYRAWKPDLVIVMHAMNDLYRSFSPPAYADGDYDELWSHFYGPSILGFKPAPFGKHLWIQFKKFTIGDYSVKDFSEKWYSSLRWQERDFPIGRYFSLPQFESHLKTLVEILKQDRVPVLLMTEPSIYHENLTPGEKKILRFGREVCAVKQGAILQEYASPASLETAMRVYNQKIREVAETEKVLFADAAGAVPKNLAHFTDDVHNTPAGAELIAAAAFEALRSVPLKEKK